MELHLGCFCGLMSYGFVNGYYREHFKSFGLGVGFTFANIALGLIGLLASLLTYRPLAFSLEPITEEEAWAEHQRKYPALPREYFEMTWKK